MFSLVGAGDTMSAISFGGCGDRFEWFDGTFARMCVFCREKGGFRSRPTLRAWLSVCRYRIGLRI